MNLRDEVQSIIDGTAKLVDPAFAARFENVKLVINTRMRTAAGKVRWHPSGAVELHINKRIYDRPENRRHLFTTVLHELGHIVAGRNAGHGSAWRNACRALGLEEPERCHDLNVEGLKRKQNRHAWHCPECGREHYATTRMDNKAKAGRVWWTCKPCGVKLVRRKAYAKV